MRQPKIIKDFLRNADGVLENQASSVAATMKDNQYFPNPAPSLEELTTVTLQFGAALIAAKTGDRLKSSEKNDLKATLQLILSNLSNYVTAAAMGSRTILISSGFTVSADASAAVGMTSVQNFSVTQGPNSGELVMKAKRVRGALSYSFSYAIVDGENTVWEHVFTTKIKTVVSGLQVGKTYTCYVKAISGKDKFIQSVSITKTVY